MQSIDDAIRQSLDASEAAHAVQPPADPEALAGFEGMTAGDFALVRENFEKGVAFMPIVEHGREHDAELLAKIREHELNETPWDDLPEEIQGWIAERDRPVVNAMTLQNVVWTSVAGREIPLSVPVRIMLTNVSLWWLGRAVRQDSDE